MEKTKSKKFKINIDKDRCKSCKLCLEYCPLICFEMSEKLNRRGVAFAKTKINYKCSGCGACFFICPETCIEINEE